jgi:hypothetical protein
MAELERLYLDGKITAKQFQKALNEHEQQGQTAAARTPAPAVPVPVAPSRTTPPPTAAPPTREPPPAVDSSPDQAEISEVEKKMDELIKAKAARDQATNTSATATNAAVATGPKTQRQRLDELLRLYIEGKLTEAEYKERREKIIAEPTTK